MALYKKLSIIVIIFKYKPKTHRIEQAVRELVFTGIRPTPSIRFPFIEYKSLKFYFKTVLAFFLKEESHIHSLSSVKKGLEYDFRTKDTMLMSFFL